MQERLISHGHSYADTATLVELIRKRIQAEGDKEHVSVSEQLAYLDSMAKFPLGQFLLKNKGVNGYWIHQILTHPRNKKNKKLTGLEEFFFERAPLTLATQERSAVFLDETQKSVKNGARLASIPSGLLGELLYLNLDGTDGVQLVGIDYDEETLFDAKELAQQRGLETQVELYQADAWQLNKKNEFDLISSNGLNIYEPNDSKVTALYQEFYHALKPGGKLVTSFVTPPAQLTTHCEWKMGQLNPQDLLQQRILYSDIVGAKWQCFRSSEQTKQQLESVGFKSIRFIYDRAHLYPTVIAYKK